MVNISIFDGTDTIQFGPGARARRELDRSAGLNLISLAQSTIPIPLDLKSTIDKWNIQTQFKNRKADYQTLWSMIKEQPNASTYTLTVGTETFTVSCLQLIMDIDPGEGELRDMIAIFVIVNPL